MIDRFTHDSALLVIDPQVGVDQLEHWGGPGARRNNPAAETHVAALLAAWRQHGLPVIFTRHESIEDVSPLRPDGPGCAFKPDLQPLPSEDVVAKSTNGAFFGTDLALRLRRRGIDRLVVAGFFTNMCVETTVRTAGNLGYDTYLAHDACATTTRVGHDGVAHAAEVVHALAVATMHGEFCTALATRDLVHLTAGSNPELHRVQGNEAGEALAATA
ncbi:MAG: isochorismatase family protein [Nocardioides sp.]|nr:isochorismatase family protein [Nocardioides sp.]